MTAAISLSKYEREVLPGFRDQLNHAESEEDVKKFFVYTVQKLLQLAIGDKFSANYEDIALDVNDPPHYKLTTELLNSDSMKKLTGSDLTSVLSRFAEQATHRYMHVAKHKEKTNSKIKNH